MLNTMKGMNWSRFIVAVFFMLPGLAFAHQEADGSGFIAGFTHPIYGLDHLLAMICVGVLSSQLGGKNIWVIPSVFVLSMVVGGIIGVYQMPLYYTEIGIALSVVILGAAIVRSDNQTKSLYIAIFVALFGMFHGHAHGLEMPDSASPVYYTFGFLTSTATLHLVGVIIGEFTVRKEKLLAGLRNVGAGVAGAGVLMLLEHVGIA